MTRNIDADLALCDAATPGDWKAYKQSAAEFSVAHVELDIFIANKRCVGDGEFVGLRENDALFIAAARDGWPWALHRLKDAEQRAQHWEAEAKQLRETLEAAQKAGLPPLGRYKCGCELVRSDKVKAFCPVHYKPAEDQPAAPATAPQEGAQP